MYHYFSLIYIHMLISLTVNTTVGTVCSSSLLGGLVDLDMLDNELVNVQALGLQRSG